MHISLNDDLSKNLEDFSKGRKISKSGGVRYALEVLFSIEGVSNPLKDNALKAVIERKFVVPKNIPIRSFYVFLYLLSKNYPLDSSRNFWSQTVYLSGIDRTHEEVFLEVQDEIQNHIKLNANGNSD